MRRVSLLPIILAMLLAAAPARADEPIVDLGPTTGTDAWHAVNDLGQVAGERDGSSIATSLALRWDNGTVTPLGTGWSRGVGIADNGTVVGFHAEDGAGYGNPAYWNPSQQLVTDWQVGVSFAFWDASPNGTGIFHGSHNGGPQQVAVAAPPYTSSTVLTPPANDGPATSSPLVNDAGHAVYSGYFFDGSTATKLSVATGGQSAMNGHDEIVGTVPADGSPAFELAPSQIANPLSPAPGANAGSTMPTAVNDDGTIVGTSSAGAVIWQPNGQVALLDSLLTQPTQWHLKTATDISNTGIIIGVGTYNGADHYYRLGAPPTSLVSGTVTDRGGKPVNGATIRLSGTDKFGGALNATALTDADGKYSFHVNPGDYTAAGTYAPSDYPGGTFKASCDGLYIKYTADERCGFTIDDSGPVTANFRYELPNFIAEDLQVIQAVQTTVSHGSGGLTVPGFTKQVSGGTYSGVPMVRGQKAVARFFAYVEDDKFTTPYTGVDAFLHGYTRTNGVLTELPGPIRASGQSLKLGPQLPGALPDAAVPVHVRPARSWTEAPNLTVVAEVDPVETGDKRPYPECTDCGDNDTYGIADIPLITERPVIIKTVTIKWKGTPFGSATGPRACPRCSGRCRTSSPCPRAARSSPIRRRRSTSHRGEAVARRHHVSSAKDCVQDNACREDIAEYEFAAIKRTFGTITDPRTFVFAYTPVPDGITDTPITRDRDRPPRPRRGRSRASPTSSAISSGSTTRAPGCRGGSSGEQADDWPPDQLGQIDGMGLDRADDAVRDQGARASAHRRCTT